MVPRQPRVNQKVKTLWDFSDLLTWNGKRIGILTMGDLSTDIIKHWDDFEGKAM
jgi:hypothetical protein